MIDSKNLDQLIENLSPVLDSTAYVFCSLESNRYGDLIHLNPISSFLEKEGLSLIVEESKAQKNGIQYDGAFNKITLNVYSSLEAVGLTFVISKTLAEKGICANVVAAFNHDHIFVSTDRSNEAMEALLELQEQARQGS